ncbi:MAG: 2-C-methyl-D-erythritol 4-phosphate cytidylyltransferase [Vallitaleaceae bacterium]|nr:2-C-methyl-D-erythritol 4-phosphate cytidylyltransferase [Vallitaleaceae bacterium]
MTTCILLAGGNGTRTGINCPKQFLEIQGKPIFSYCLQTLELIEEVDVIVIVVLETWESYVREWIQKLGLKKSKYIVHGGKSRQHSIYNGLIKARVYMADEDIVMVHDAARPLINPEVVRKTIIKARETGAAIPVIKENDALYMSADDINVEQTLSKSGLYRGQTPVCIRFGDYYNLHTAARDEDLINAKGSCTLLFQNDIKVTMVEGDEKTYKITTKKDVEMFIGYLSLLHEDYFWFDK